MFFEENPKESCSAQGPDKNKAIWADRTGHDEFCPNIVGAVNKGYG
jgi:hypothetical protein